MNRKNERKPLKILSSLSTNSKNKSQKLKRDLIKKNSITMMKKGCRNEKFLIEIIIIILLLTLMKIKIRNLKNRLLVPKTLKIKTKIRMTKNQKKKR